MTGSKPLPTLSGDRYTVVREVGRGGMGVVYEAIDRETNTALALKLLPTTSASALLGFKHEFRALTQVLHPNLVTPYELVADGAQWYFTMELVPGVTFTSWVVNGRDVQHVIDNETRPSLAALVDEARLRDALRQLAIGVSELHRNGLLHCDLKPPNVLVRDDGRVSILDFGLTVDLLDAQASGDKAAGTVAYMAPEQMSRESLGSAADWFAVGVMLYEALTGRLPFRGPVRQAYFQKITGTFIPPGELVRDVPEDLEALCCALLDGDPAERPTGSEVVARVQSGAPAAVMHRSSRVGASQLFVGRDAEAAALADAAARAARGETAVVQLHGRSGAGKSSLLQHFLRQQRDDPDTVVLAGRCYEQESVPFKAVDTVIDSLTRWLGRLAPTDADALMPPDIGALLRIFPVMGRVSAVTAAAHGEAPVPDPRELRRRAFAALRTLLVRIGAHRPLVVVIDDLQWGDVDSAELLASLVEVQADAPLHALFVLAYRSEYRDTSRCLQSLKAGLRVVRATTDVHELELRPLDSASAASLASGLLDPALHGAAGMARADRIARESGGNPFLLNELARYANEHPEWLLDETARRVDLDEVIWSRVARLPAPARALLEVVAIAGQPLRNADWRDSSAASAREPYALALLRHQRLIRSAGAAADDEVETYHDRIREVITTRLSADERRGWHLRLAESLDRRQAADPETIASHYAAGDDSVRAWPYYAQAAAQASNALAFDRAATLYAAALQHQPQGDADARRTLLVSLAGALANAGRGKQAAERYDEAAGLTSNREALNQLQRLAASQYCLSGAIDIGRERFREVLRGVGLRPAQSGPGILAQLMTRRARLRLRGLDFTPRDASQVPADLLRRLDALWAASTALSSVDVVGVAALQSKALLLALEAGEPRRLADALGWEAVLTATGGAPALPRARQLLQVARELTATVNEPAASGMMHLSDGWVSFLVTDLPHALSQVADAEEIFRNQCVGVWWELLMSRTLLAWGMTHVGALEPLADRCRDWEQEGRARGDHFIRTNLLAYPLPHERMLRDDVPAAREALREALALWPYRGFHIQHVSVLFSDAMLALYTGDGAGACRMVSEKWRTMVSTLQTQNQQTRVMLRDVRARGALAAAAAGIDRRAHLARVERDAASLAGERSPWATAVSLRLRAGLAQLAGDDARAATLLREALPGLEQAGLSLQATAVRRRLGALIGGDDGRTMSADASSAMRALGIVDPDAVTRLFAIP